MRIKVRPLAKPKQSVNLWNFKDLVSGIKIQNPKNNAIGFFIKRTGLSTAQKGVSK